MRHSLRTARMTLIAAAAFIAFDVTAGGFLENAWNGLADAAHQLVTLGGAGRERDRQRAEAELRRVTEAKEAAERLRQAKVEALLKDVALLRDVTRSFESSAQAVLKVGQLQEQILLVASGEIAARGQAFALVEKARDWLRSDKNDMLEILTALNAVPFMTDADLTATFGRPNERDTAKLEVLKAKQQVVVDALKAKVDVVAKSGVTETVFLEQALTRIKTEGLTAIVGLAQSSRVRLAHLGTVLEVSRKTYRKQLAVQLDALVALQAGDRKALGAKWEADLQPLEGQPVAGGSSLNPPGQPLLSASGMSSARELAVQGTPRFAAQAQVSGAPLPPTVQTICLSFNRGCF